jgi:hypothetical protein
MPGEALCKAQKNLCKRQKQHQVLDLLQGLVKLNIVSFIELFLKTTAAQMSDSIFECRFVINCNTAGKMTSMY